MPALKIVAPELVAELKAALIDEGRDDLSNQLEHVMIDRCTYEDRDRLGYIYFVCPATSALFEKLGAPVAETVVFYFERGINVDVDHDGRLIGLELIGRPEIMKRVMPHNNLLTRALHAFRQWIAERARR